ncbi:tripartite tricarboxylate transporter substrate-binding protein [Natrinema versiforme]|nr:tripartite tricarboxylate transporter substrate-binding protein [Natrinema versiforme]
MTHRRSATRRRVLFTIGSAAVGATAGCLGNNGSEEDTIVIPWGAGGSTDTLFREFGPLWADELEISDFNYENREGAGSRQGMNYAFTQESDGSTLVGNAITAAVGGQKMYDTRYDMREFTSIGSTVGLFPAWYAEPDKYDDFSSFVEELRNPDSTPVIASTGRGSFNDIALEMTLSNLDIPTDNYRVLPTDSGSAAAQAPASPDADAAVVIMQPSLLGYLEDGLAEILLHAQDTEESSLVPEAPTIQTIDHDVPEFTAEYGVWAPPGLEEENQTTLTETMQTTVEKSEFQNWASDQGFSIINNNAEQLSESTDEMLNTLDDYVGRVDEGI